MLRQALHFRGGWFIAQNEAWLRLFDAVAGAPIILVVLAGSMGTTAADRDRAGYPSFSVISPDCSRDYRWRGGVVIVQVQG